MKQIFSLDGADEPFEEGMGYGDKGNRFDLAFIPPGLNPLGIANKR